MLPYVSEIDKIKSKAGSKSGVGLIELCDDDVYLQVCIKVRTIVRQNSKQSNTYFKVFCRSLFGSSLIQYVLSKSHFHVCSTIGKNCPCAISIPNLLNVDSAMDSGTVYPFSPDKFKSYRNSGKI